MITLYEVYFIINDGEEVSFRIEATSKNEAIAIAAAMLDEGDLIHEVCAARIFGAAA